MSKKERETKEENDRFVEMIATLEKKIEKYQKNELNLLESTQQYKHEAEESNFLRESSLEREKLLQKQIDTLNHDLLELPKKYAEKNEHQVQMYIKKLKLAYDSNLI